MFKKFLQNILPPVAIRLLSGIYYGWHGNYPTWDEAKKKVSGYDSDTIFLKVKESALKVRDGKSVFERDSVLFEKVQYSFPLLSGLMWIAALKKGKLNVLDFGGSLGSTYYQNKSFLDTLDDFNWCIVEQPQFVSEGMKNFSNNNLHFFYSIEECIKAYNIDIVLLSSVLQYIERPYDLLEKVKSFNFNYIIIDRTPFIKGKDRITIQRVNPKIYTAEYPCWFFNEKDFTANLSSSYELITEFDALDRANILSEYKGFIYKKI